MASRSISQGAYSLIERLREETVPGRETFDDEVPFDERQLQARQPPPRQSSSGVFRRPCVDPPGFRSIGVVVREDQGGEVTETSEETQSSSTSRKQKPKSNRRNGIKRTVQFPSQDTTESSHTPADTSVKPTNVKPLFDETDTSASTTPSPATSSLSSHQSKPKPITTPRYTRRFSRNSSICILAFFHLSTVLNHSLRSPSKNRERSRS